MKSSNSPSCPRCGTPIPAGATDQLCPACLMSVAIDPPGEADETIPMASGHGVPRGAHTEFPTQFGGYRLFGLLGRGGMGTVYEAEHIASGRRVALKMLGQQLDSPDMRQRFLREGRLAARVNHPNSLYIFGSEEIEGHPVITMEIAGSGTLKDSLKRCGPLPVTEAVDAILDVVAGLEAAFTGGVLHRDIKPSNCFVCPDGSGKVGDFGLSVSTLARTDTLVTAHGRIMGTPAYASPEQLRGDDLDVRADIYSVGGTLFSLLTNRPPFEGDNAVQVVAQAVNQEPQPLRELREDVPAGLARVVARCLAKEPDQRYADYPALRDALLPFSSKEPEPASMKLRASVGWVDYLIAFLIPYVLLMLSIGAEELLIRPVVERTLYSARYHLGLISFGLLYFSIAEGIWGAGLGKRLKGLRVVRPDGRAPGIGRALIRGLIPILCVEGFRIPLTMAFISDPDLTGLQIALFVVIANISGWIPVLLTLRARPDNGYTTVWDLLSGTRVVVKPKGVMRLPLEQTTPPERPAEDARSLGPYRIVDELAPGRWLLASDPVLRRQVWLRRRDDTEPSVARRVIARPGRLRWLQKVDADGVTWDAFDATQGVPLSDLVTDGKQIRWGTLRHWLHDLASELWDASRDGTLPAELSLDHVWITSQGQAILLDEAWPVGITRTKGMRVGDLAGQQSFLNAVAGCLESTSLPLHARPALRNLAQGKFEKLSFLAGTLRGLLDKPTEVTPGIRAGSIFMLPIYVWILVFVGYYQGERVQQWSGSLGELIMISMMVVLAARALVQLLELPLRTTCSHAVFRLGVINAEGERAKASHLLRRWAIVWLPLMAPMGVAALMVSRVGGATVLIPAYGVLLLWLSAAAHTVLHPTRGWHDRLAGSWVVRQ